MGMGMHGHFKVPAFVVETRLGSAGVVFQGDDGSFEFVAYDGRFRRMESVAYGSVGEAERAARRMVREDALSPVAADP